MTIDPSIPQCPDGAGFSLTKRGGGEEGGGEKRGDG